MFADYIPGYGNEFLSEYSGPETKYKIKSNYNVKLGKLAITDNYILKYFEVYMEQTEQIELARTLANLKLKGYSILAQYDFTGDEENFLGIWIKPVTPASRLSLERTAEIITNQKGLINKPGGNS
jgi:hypothetical protein